MNRLQRLHKSIPEIYCSCDVSIIPTDCDDATTATANTCCSSNITPLSTSASASPSPSANVSATDRHRATDPVFRQCQTTAYFRDTQSKRAKIVVPILLTFANEFDRKAIIRSGAIQPLPTEPSSKTNAMSDLENKHKSDVSVSDAGTGTGIDIANNSNINDSSTNNFGRLSSVGSFGDASIVSEGSKIWSSELDTLGETRGESSVKKNTEKIELKFECSCYNVMDDSDRDDNYHGCGDGYDNSGKEKGTIVEGVSILSTSKVDTDDLVGIRFDVEISLRSSSPPSSSFSPSVTNNKSANNCNSSNNKKRIQIRSILVCTNTKPMFDYGDNESSVFDSKLSLQDLENDEMKSSLEHIYLAQQALDMGANSISPYDDRYSDVPTSSYFARSLSYSLPSNPDMGLYLYFDLVPALTISVKEVRSASSHTGVTLVSLIIGHSNMHNEDVTITNIALHPGHSRLFNIFGSMDTKGVTMPGEEHSTINMSKYVRWGYAKGTSPSLPLTLKPQEAIATVIQINASENMDARTFISPIGVRGIIGKTVTARILNGMCNGDDVADTFRDEEGNNTSMVMVSADAKWTTSRIATETVDAFRVNLSVQESECHVGAQVVVSLKVMNLSEESRNLTLVMAKEENPYEDFDRKKDGPIKYTDGHVKDSINSSSNSLSTLAPIGVNNAIVCEVNGYAFGVWGLSGKDDGTVRYNRDHELLAVDAALLLGEVKGQHSIEAELRFVPLREGSLKVPNLRLYDNYNQRWYDCIHTLKIVTLPSQ